MISSPPSEGTLSYRFNWRRWPYLPAMSKHPFRKMKDSVGSAINCNLSDAATLAGQVLGSSHRQFPSSAQCFTHLVVCAHCATRMLSLWLDPKLCFTPQHRTLRPSCHIERGEHCASVLELSSSLIINASTYLHHFSSEVHRACCSLLRLNWMHR